MLSNRLPFTLFGMLIGMLASLRMVVYSSEMDSTTPVTTTVPCTESSETRSPFMKFWLTYCAAASEIFI